MSAIVADGGIDFQLSAKTVQDKRCSAYLAAAKAKLQGARTLEICMDDARFSPKEHCLATVFANGLTVYPPPQIIRELAWEADPGDSSSLPGGVSRRKKGLRGVEMMRSYDMLRCIERFAEQAAGWSLGCIRLPEPLLPMQPGQVRFWSKKQYGWVRTNLATKDSAPELPGNMLDPSTQMVLLLCMDQASTNHAVADFLPSPGGFNGCVLATEDPFHRAHNDWKFALRHAIGWFEHTVLQMTVVYNLPYGPWLHAANLSARREAMDELMKDGRVASVIQAFALGHMASDARRPVPADSAEATDMVEERLEASGFLRKKGPYVKHMRFFSYLEAAAYYDEDRTAWTALTHWLSKTIHGDESVSTKVKEQVAQSLYDAAGGERGEDAVSARARLQDIRKRVGNSMQLAPLLMTRENR